MQKIFYLPETGWSELLIEVDSDWEERNYGGAEAFYEGMKLWME